MGLLSRIRGHHTQSKAFQKEPAQKKQRPRRVFSDGAFGNEVLAAATFPTDDLCSHRRWRASTDPMTLAGNAGLAVGSGQNAVCPAPRARSPRGRCAPGSLRPPSPKKQRPRRMYDGAFGNKVLAAAYFPTDDLCSIIGDGGLNCRVRNGNGCTPSSMATRTNTENISVYIGRVFACGG